MTLTREQARWFQFNPGRLYHLTAVSPAEAMGWPSPPPLGSTAWRVTRFEDGASMVFQMDSEEIPENTDGVLRQMFGRLTGDEA